MSDERRSEQTRGSGVAPGQRWRLWVYDDSIQETITIDSVAAGMVNGHLPDGCPCTVGEARLLARGELIA